MPARRKTRSTTKKRKAAQKKVDETQQEEEVQQEDPSKSVEDQNLENKVNEPLEDEKAPDVEEGVKEVQENDVDQQKIEVKNVENFDQKNQEIDNTGNQQEASKVQEETKELQSGISTLSEVDEVPKNQEEMVQENEAKKSQKESTLPIQEGLLEIQPTQQDIIPENSHPKSNRRLVRFPTPEKTPIDHSPSLQNNEANKTTLQVSEGLQNMEQSPSLGKRPLLQDSLQPQHPITSPSVKEQSIIDHQFQQNRDYNLVPRKRLKSSTPQNPYQADEYDQHGEQAVAEGQQHGQQYYLEEDDNNYYYYYDESKMKQPPFELDESVQEMILKLEKNPTALLNEYVSRSKELLEFHIESEKTHLRQIFYCQISLDKKPLHPQLESGESKQEAKKAAASEAIKALCQKDEAKKILREMLVRQRRNQMMDLQNGIPKSNPNYSSIPELLKDEVNILSILNTFAQNCKEQIKWCIKSDGSLCVAEIRIGQLVSSAVKTNKKQAKLWAAKNLLKLINANTFLREKFIYYTYTTRVKEQEKKVASDTLQTTLERVLPPEPEKPDFKQDLKPLNPSKASPLELRNWFYHLDTVLAIDDQVWADLGEIYSQVSDILVNLCPGQGLVLLPVGSFLMGSMRKDLHTIDAILFSEAMMVNLSFESIKNSFYERKDGFQLINNNYRFFEAEIIEDKKAGQKSLIFTQTYSGIKVRFRTFIDNGNEYTNQNGKIINMINSSIYHAIWLEEQIANQNINQDLVKLMRLLREWRDVHGLKMPSEVIDICIFYSTSYFKEFDMVRVIIKFFALVNLLINPYNFYFYELSEYHAFLIKSISDEEKEKILKVSHSSFLAVSKNDPSEFGERVMLKNQGGEDQQVLEEEGEENKENFQDGSEIQENILLPLAMKMEPESASKTTPLQASIIPESQESHLEAKEANQDPKNENPTPQQEGIQEPPKTQEENTHTMEPETAVPQPTLQA